MKYTVHTISVRSFSIASSIEFLCRRPTPVVEWLLSHVLVWLVLWTLLVREHGEALFSHFVLMQLAASTRDW